MQCSKLVDLHSEDQQQGPPVGQSKDGKLKISFHDISQAPPGLQSAPHQGSGSLQAAALQDSAIVDTTAQQRSTDPVGSHQQSGSSHRASDQHGASSQTATQQHSGSIQTAADQQNGSLPTLPNLPAPQQQPRIKEFTTVSALAYLQGREVHDGDSDDWRQLTPGAVASLKQLLAADQPLPALAPLWLSLKYKVSILGCCLLCTYSNRVG